MKTLFINAIVFTAIASISCKDINKNKSEAPTSNEVQQKDVNAEGEVVDDNEQKAKATAILAEYLSIKNALAKDSNEEAAHAGSKLVSVLEDFDISDYTDSEQTDLKNIILEAKGHGERIVAGTLEQQREYFRALSTELTGMVSITGTEKKLYEQFCPMYDKGSTWLSASNEVRNPYFGSKMLTCGKVQREIN